MRTFYPKKTLIIPASEPHESGAAYKVSVGDEDWGDGTYQSVVKVQMMYDGKVAGRMSPSFPVDSQDWQRVCLAVGQLTTGHEMPDGTVYVPMLLQPETLMSEFYEILNYVVESPKSEKSRYMGNNYNFVSYESVSLFDFMFDHLCDEIKVYKDCHSKEGIALCDQMIQKLEELDTNDDTFPQNAIDTLNLIRKHAEEH